MKILAIFACCIVFGIAVGVGMVHGFAAACRGVDE